LGTVAGCPLDIQLNPNLFSLRCGDASPKRFIKNWKDRRRGGGGTVDTLPVIFREKVKKSEGSIGLSAGNNHMIRGRGRQGRDRRMSVSKVLG